MVNLAAAKRRTVRARQSGDPPHSPPSSTKLSSGNECFGVSVWFRPVVKFGKTSKVSTAYVAGKLEGPKSLSFFLSRG